MTVRSWLYFLARRLGDLQALLSGRLGQRLVNIIIGRALGRIGGMLWRRPGSR